MAKTMAQAEKKSLGIARMIIGFLTLIIFSLFYLNLGGTLFYQYHLAASETWQWIGGISFALCLVTLILYNKLTYWVESDTAWYVIWFGLLLFGFFASAQFTFDLK